VLSNDTILDDLEWRNSPYFTFFTEFDSFAVVEDRPIM